MMVANNIKIALFIINFGYNAHFNAVAAILYTQIFDCLIRKAESLYNGKLPLHVSCYLDDLPAYHLPHDFNMTLSVLKGSNISVAMLLQSVSELKTIFGRNSELVVDVCGTKLLMNGNGYEFPSKATIPVTELAWVKRNHGCIWINDTCGIGTGRRYDLAKHPTILLQQMQMKIISMFSEKKERASH